MLNKYTLLGAIALCSPAYAQQTETTEVTRVVVTATKTETDLQDTPISIAVVSDEDLKNRQVQSLLDLADGGVPSLRVATFESRQSALTVGMRGIVPGDANQPAREQGVGVYIDGIYLGRQHGLNAGFLDLERIEVLRGPQGTLFGRNTEGGAVNLISKSPTGNFEGSLTTGFGNYGSYNTNLKLNLPEVNGISVKLDAGIQHQDATIENPMKDQYGWNYYHRYGARLATKWDISENLKVTFASDFGRDENTPFLSQLINYNPTNKPVATLAQIAAVGNKIPSGYIAPLPSIAKVSPERIDVSDIGVPQKPSLGKTAGVMSSIEWDINDNLEFRSLSAWRSVSDEQFDNSGGAYRTPTFLPNATFSRYSIAELEQSQFSQEFQAVGSADNLSYVFGAYYFIETASDAARTPNTNKWNAFGTDYTIVDPSTYALATVARASKANSKSYAIYGQGTYTLKDWHFTLGGRLTRDMKDGTLFTVNGSKTNFTFEQNNDRFDPITTIAYDINEHINVYAKYATGYRAGGASSRSLIYRPFGPESTKSYELGSKMELFNQTVTLNAAAYMMERKDSQVDFNFFIPQANGTIRNTLETVNAEGITEINGLELDVSLNIVDNLSTTLSYAYTDTKLPKARNTVQEQLNASLVPAVLTPVFQNVFIVYTPEHAVTGSVDYKYELSNMTVKFHLDANYSSPSYTFDNEDVKNEESFIVNGRITFDDIQLDNYEFSAALWSRNILDTSYIYRRSNANRLVLGDYANFNAPRTYGVEITSKF
jgi:iron complex outermembrane receptor protein